MEAVEEILDLVDENDQIIGEVKKSEANKNPQLIHREIGVQLYNDERKLLLQKRSYKKPIRPGVWEVTCAGHVNKGEKPLDAAHRELMEELGFDVDLKYVEKQKQTLFNETHFTYVYLGKYDNETIKLDREEVEEARLFGKSEVEELVNSGATFGPNSYRFCIRFWKGEFDHLLSSF